MAYRVDLSISALRDAENAYLWLREQAPEKADDWYRGLLEAVYSLENFPNRCPLAPKPALLLLKSANCCTANAASSLESCSAFRLTPKQAKIWFWFTVFATAHNDIWKAWKF